MSRGPVLILYNEPAAAKAGGFLESDAGVLVEVAAVAEACRKLRRPCRTVGVRDYGQLPEVLSGADESVVFNLVEGFADHPERAAFVPAVCAAFGKACTGTPTPGLLLSLDKWQSKILLEGAGLPVPRGRLVTVDAAWAEARPTDWPGPYIVKPVGADASEGIDAASVVSDAGRALKQAVARVHERFGQPALVEQYIEGRELNVSVIWRGDEPEVLPLAEIDFNAFDASRPRIVGYEAKWLADTFEYHHTPRIIPSPLPAKVARRVRELAVAACRCLDCRDYCRVDMRLDQALEPYILEVNANPDISPDAGFAAALEAAEIAYHDFVRLTIDNAVSRLARPRTRARRRIGAKAGAGDLRIVWCQASHRDAVVSLLTGTQMFRPGEVQIAKEVLDDGIRGGPDGHYQSYVAVRGGEVLGWVSFGPTPCTIGTWDLYWIAVAASCQGQGIGRALMAFAESEIRSRGGRRVIVETSGRDAYIPTVAFYERIGYLREATLQDFYDIGDGKVVLTKCVAPTIAS
ncbi:MAG: GNAT family N-acetyltransferase [Sedimentisphaerales bacterium]|jgi:D-alanine-D-alanine ligase|nr:GNAT family N-acetyltransferase [Sedimentisphaerales bacterium]HNY78101.1 GNAT family N-acetyltransferase [Sedimentisphaerales bacterium]HOC63181.1 GNAT family N-acetyltransferase [Sedimentisphaerales bacterium]HOH64276.1 GNAT family N-acetyltransferase [Sedimentisphaerales bacterium]HPY51668.1 GNAT family N-acetyltransferase [Sedimentisphaerales bacterium]